MRYFSSTVGMARRWTMIGLAMSALALWGLSPMDGLAQPIFQPASGCKEGAIITAEQALNPGTGGFTQTRTIIPGEDTSVVLGAWVVRDAHVAAPGVGTPNCPASPGDGNPLYVTELTIDTVRGDPARVGVTSVTFWRDNDFDGQFTPGRDTQMGSPLPGSCLTDAAGCTLSFGNVPIFGGMGGLADPTMGGFCPMMGTAGGCGALLAVAEVQNPQGGAQLQVRLEGEAVNLVNNPSPIGSGFAPQFQRSGSNIRVQVEGSPSGGGSPGGGGSGSSLLPNINNGSGSPEVGFKGVQVQGVRTRDDSGGLTGTQARDARPGDREYVVGLVALCDGGDIATDAVTMNPPIAGPMTIAGGPGAIPCIGPGDTDGNPLNVVRVRVGVQGSGAQYVQAIHAYADLGTGSGWGGIGLGGTLFGSGEQILSGIPVGGVAAVGSLEQTLATSGGTLLRLGPSLPGAAAGLLYVTIDISDTASSSQLTVQVAVDAADIPGTTSSRLMRTQPAQFQVTISGGTPSGPPSGPPSSGDGRLSSYDDNGNCRLDDGEFLSLIDRWINRAVSDSLFFASIDAWVSQSNICAASAGADLARPTVRAMAHPLDGTVAFTPVGMNAGRFEVSVYALSGRALFHGEGHGRPLSWNLTDPAGRPVANGVYLYRATAFGPDGALIESRIAKLRVSR